MNNNRSKRKRLRKPARALVLRRLAEFVPAQEIMAELKETFRVEVTPQAIDYYRGKDTYQPRIQELREAYLEELEKNNRLAHKEARLASLRDIHDNSQDDRVKLTALKQIKDEVDPEKPASPNMVNINTNTQNTEVPAGRHPHEFFHDMTDEELEAQREAILKELIEEQGLMPIPVENENSLSKEELKAKRWEMYEKITKLFSMAGSNRALAYDNEFRDN